MTSNLEKDGNGLLIVATGNVMSSVTLVPPIKFPAILTISSTSYPLPPDTIATASIPPLPFVVTVNVAPVPPNSPVDATPVYV